MNYIVFDLEWNQCYGGQEFVNPRMPSEIIEIGAVKLDEKLNIIDRYESYVRPRLYRRLQPHIKAILNYDEKTLKNGRPFDVVCREFLKWCGDDYIFCTWGSMDLSYLQNNMDYYYMKKLPIPLMFYNVQQIYADIEEKSQSAVKLEKAVDKLLIGKDRPFHSAENDAYYTALVLARLNPKDLSDRYSYDTYNTPKEKEDEIVSYHKNFMEHISREYENRMEAIADKDLITLYCYRCGRKASKKIKWFANTPHSYLCVGKCWHHGLMTGKLKFKSTRDDKIFVIKTVVPTDKKGLEATRQRQNELRIKRQEKRHNKNNKDYPDDFEIEIDD